MGKWIRGLVWLLAIGLFWQNLQTWGGLALTPTIGQQLRSQASVQSPLAATYLFLGRHLVHGLGMDDSARERVARRFGPQVADTDSPPATVIPRFLSAQSASERFAYYGAPLLFVLALVLHARRQKPIRSFGVRD
jgi:hypothetical protein